MSFALQQGGVITTMQLCPMMYIGFDHQAMAGPFRKEVTVINWETFWKASLHKISHVGKDEWAASSEVLVGIPEQTLSRKAPDKPIRWIERASFSWVETSSVRWDCYWGPRKATGVILLLLWAGTPQLMLTLSQGGRTHGVIAALTPINTIILHVLKLGEIKMVTWFLLPSKEVSGWAEIWVHHFTYQETKPFNTHVASWPCLLMFALGVCMWNIKPKLLLTEQASNLPISPSCFSGKAFLSQKKLHPASIGSSAPLPNSGCRANLA